MNPDLNTSLLSQGRSAEGVLGAGLWVLLRRPVLHVRHAEPRLRPLGRQGDQAVQEDRRARGQLGPWLRVQHPRGLVTGNTWSHLVTIGHIWHQLVTSDNC